MMIFNELVRLNVNAARLRSVAGKEMERFVSFLLIETGRIYVDDVGIGLSEMSIYTEYRTVSHHDSRRNRRSARKVTF